MDIEMLENLVEGIEIEDFNTRAIQQLKPFHMIVLISYIKIALRKIEITMINAYKEYEIFKAKSPMIVYVIDKFTFNILTNFLIKASLLKIIKNHIVQRFTTYRLNFDPTSVVYSIKKGTIVIPTAVEEWIIDT